MPENAWWTRWTLRAVGTFDLLAWLAVFFSAEAMSATHAWLGLGELQTAPVVGYLARTASMQYGLHGILLWAIASDVSRYGPLVGWLIGLKLIQAGAILVVDWAEGMPLWWTIVEPACLALMAVALASARTRDRMAGSAVGDAVSSG